MSNGSGVEEDYIAVNKFETSNHTTRARITPEQSVLCNDCGRSFKKPGNLKRQNSLTERAKLILEQRGAVQYQHCYQWMKSAGGLKVHLKKCVPPM